MEKLQTEVAKEVSEGSKIVTRRRTRGGARGLTRGRPVPVCQSTPPHQSTPVLPLVLAGKAPRKARGLLFTRPNKGAMLFMPCSDVHTVGMRHRLDIAFVDASGMVLETYRDVGPFRRLRGKGAVAVVERFSSCASPWFSSGDRLGVVCVEGGRP